MSTNDAVYVKSYLIQRMRMVNKCNQVRLSKRFEMDYMGSTEFEVGALARTMRRINLHMDSGIIDFNTIHGAIKIYVAWDNCAYNRAGVELALRNIWDNNWRLKEQSGFDTVRYKNQVIDKIHPTAGHDSWVDIENGLFWTWAKCNPADFIRNVEKSVKWMDLSPEERDLKTKEEHDEKVRSQERENRMDPLRQKLIGEGKLRPSPN